MKFHYMGKFDGDYEKLPGREHEEGHVAFREPDGKKLPIVINALSFALAAVLTIPAIIFGQEGRAAFIDAHGVLPFALLFVALILASSMLLIFPHELLHAVCFKGDVYMYTDLGRGLCFVVGPELFSKTRFIIMCMMPNVVFGIIPYIIWIIFPNIWWLGIYGAAAVSMGAGDYMNVFNAAVQIPRGAKTYMHGVNSFWVRTDKKD